MSRSTVKSGGGFSRQVLSGGASERSPPLGGDPLVTTSHFLYVSLKSFLKNCSSQDWFNMNENDDKDS